MEELKVGSARYRLSKGFDTLHDAVRRISLACDSLGHDEESYELVTRLETEFLKIVRGLRKHYSIPYHLHKDEKEESNETVS